MDSLSRTQKWGMVAALGVVAAALLLIGALAAINGALLIGVVELLVGLVVVLALLVSRAEIAPAQGGHGSTRLGISAAIAGAAVFVLMLSGGFTSGNATAPCSEWPTCDGNYVPLGTSATDLHLVHRWLALIAVLAIGVLLITAWRQRGTHPALLGLATATAALTAAQIFVGAANIWFSLNPAVSAAHFGVATLIWSGLVALVVLDRWLPAADPATLPARRPARAVLDDYIAATKPGVMVLLLLTTLAAMIAGAVGLPPLRILFWTLVGGALSAGGAAAINQYVDRDIDAIMTRTRNRPIPAGRVAPVQFAIYGVVLTVLSVLLLTAFVSPLVALITLSGNLFYVFIYTLWLKRSTPQNIVIGGAAGSVPPVAGWAAATGGIAAPAILMFWLIFLWTPPHFWALALFKRGDYAAAGVPMMPAVRGDAETRKQILLYSVVMVISSLLFVPFGGAGLLYLIAASAFGVWFIIRATRLYYSHSDTDARRLFFFSIQYLGLVFLALVIDRLIGI